MLFVRRNDRLTLPAGWRRKSSGVSAEERPEHIRLSRHCSLGTRLRWWRHSRRLRERSKRAQMDRRADGLLQSGHRRLSISSIVETDWLSLHMLIDQTNFFKVTYRRLRLRSFHQCFEWATLDRERNVVFDKSLRWLNTPKNNIRFEASLLDINVFLFVHS